jgi:endonuclease-3
MQPASRLAIKPVFTRLNSDDANAKPIATTEEKKPRRGRKDDLEPSQEPKNWREVYALIREQRTHITAPVDVYGPDKLPYSRDPKQYRYEVLVALMLSPQTKEQPIAQSFANLKQHGLTIDNIINTDAAVIDKLIYKCGFHTRKAVFIKQTSQILKERYNGDIPSNINELMALPGVGPKMSLMIMEVAWNKVEGIAADIYVERVCNRLGWISTKTLEDTRRSLESWLPREYWGEAVPLFVGFGEKVCTALRPKCGDCSVNHLCPSAFKYCPPRKDKRIAK